jgi:hypothetical protein
MAAGGFRRGALGALVAVALAGAVVAAVAGELGAAVGALLLAGAVGRAWRRAADDA